MQLHGPVGAPLQPQKDNAKPAETPVLSLDDLIAQVLERNPGLAQMAAAWEAASARYPQVRSLDDPMFSAMVAPASFGSKIAEPGYRLEIAQKFPFPGKLPLRGQAALAEASAAGNEVEVIRLELIEATKLAFADYYLVGRALAVNAESLTLLKRYRQNADTRFRNNQAPEQDVLQADVELGRQRERGVTLERMRKVAVARLNTLMSLPPDETLASPPGRLPAAPAPPSVEFLRAFALAQRPDLKALEDRIAAEQTALALARREYFPDVEVSGAFDAIMGNGPMRDLAPQVGVRLNIPVRYARRQAAVAEAYARIAQRQAELAKSVNQVNFEVHEAYEQLRESERIIDLYAKNIIPAAESNVKAADAAYITGKIPFLSLIEAQRNLVNLRDRFYEASADYFRRLATLERVIGGPLPAPETPRVQPAPDKPSAR